MAEVALPALQNVHGDLWLGPDFNKALTTLSLPALTHARNIWFNYGPDHFTSLDLSSLTTVDEDFYITGGDNLAVSLPALQSVGGRFSIYWGMTTLDAPSLESVGTVFELTNLTTLNVPALTTVGSSIAFYHMQSSVLDFPALVSIGAGAPPPLSTALDLDPDAEFGICHPGDSHPFLAAIHFPLLTNLGPSNTGIFNIGNNPLLPQCQIDALASQLQGAGWTGSVQVSDPVGCQTSSTCP
ncbi:hypothetical protein A7982_13479 [Minicystis rosea]|nr:hypothetical protein A7982_13479 [Minicystis rosea]